MISSIGEKGLSSLAGFRAIFLFRSGVILAASLWVGVASASVEHLGTFGNVYPIKEKDAIAAIKEKLEKMETSGQMDEIRKSWQEKALTRIENGPDAVPGIEHAHHKQDQVRFFDPTIEVVESIKDDKGRIIVPAGTRVNPLDYMNLKRKYLFIDGNDKKQVEWAVDFVKKNGGDLGARIILVNGSPMKLSREYGVRFFFDQGGRIVHRLGIVSVPSIVGSQDDRVQITEVAGF